MGIKCRLLGHAYGNPEVDRSREEQGDEVVITVRNLKMCERCGDERVVNQTREVTSVRSPDEVDLDTPEASTSEPSGDASDPGASEPNAADSPVTPADPSPASDADPTGVTDGDESAVEPAVAPADAADTWETGSDEWDGVDVDTDIDDAVILDDGKTQHDEAQWPEDADADRSDVADTPETIKGATASGVDADPTGEPGIVDAGKESVDADADADAADGRTGEWPDHDDVGSDPGEWPEHDTSDEGYSATPHEDVDAEFEGNGLTPEVNGGAVDSGDIDGVVGDPSDGRAAETTHAVDADVADEGFVRATESPSESDLPDDRIEFYCPGCGYTQAAGHSSLRAGDICPECKQGYIAEREP